jgi:hypothetical protein
MVPAFCGCWQVGYGLRHPVKLAMVAGFEVGWLWAELESLTGRSLQFSRLRAVAAAAWRGQGLQQVLPGGKGTQTAAGGIPFALKPKGVNLRSAPAQTAQASLPSYDAEQRFNNRSRILNEKLLDNGSTTSGQWQYHSLYAESFMWIRGPEPGGRSVGANSFEDHRRSSQHRYSAPVRWTASL